MELYIRQLQKRIVSHLSEIEEDAQRRKGAPKNTFLFDSWTRKEGGGGVSCVLQDGVVFEKAGVNISIIHGTLSPGKVID